MHTQALGATGDDVNAVVSIAVQILIKSEKKTGKFHRCLDLRRLELPMIEEVVQQHREYGSLAPKNKNDVKRGAY
jgi:hypothetical protein